jgi:hypothetical protein
LRSIGQLLAKTDLRIEKHSISMIFQESLLLRTEGTDVHVAIDRYTHTLQGRSMGHRRHKQATAPLEGNESAIG